MTYWMKIILAILGLPKSLWICFRSLPLRQAIKIPIIVSPFIKIISTKGKIEIHSNNVSLGMISFGLNGYGLALHEVCVLQNNGLIVFLGKNRLGCGTRISCNDGGRLTFGEYNEFVGLCSIICNYSVTFGNDCLISWNTQFMDSDMHHIIHNSHKINFDAAVKIGNHVWVCSNVYIYKGSIIQDNSIIGGNSVVIGKRFDSNSIVAGNLAQVIRNNIMWKK